MVSVIVTVNYRVCQVLGDIELAQSMQKEKTKGLEGKEEVPHPLDVDYGLLKARLSLLDPKTKDFKVGAAQTMTVVPVYINLQKSLKNWLL